MSGVFQNIDPPHPHPLARVYPLLWCGGVERGWGVKSSEDARHCSVLYVQYVSTLWSVSFILSFTIYCPDTSYILYYYCIIEACQWSQNHKIHLSIKNLFMKNLDLANIKCKSFFRIWIFSVKNLFLIKKGNPEGIECKVKNKFLTDL